ncbi:MAG TPA: hypothetical protein VGN93_21110 [Shinella sp.]|nr:hypothetical protein [Shinella sp.]
MAELPMRPPAALFSGTSRRAVFAAMQPGDHENLLRCHIFWRTVTHTQHP